MKKLNLFLNIIIGGLIFIFFLSYLNAKYQLFYNKPKVYKNDLSSIDSEKVINKYLKQTADKIVLDRRETKKILDEALKKQIQLLSQVPKSKNQISQLPLEQQISKNTENASFSQIVQNSEMNDFERQEYARQFIENARKGGYHIELSRDLKVISVTPLRLPSQDVDSFEILPSN